MKKLVFLFCMTFMITGLAMAQTATDTETKTEESQEAKPKMEFETMEVDFGTIEKGSDPYRTVTFTNTGEAPLIIQNAKGSCGCTVPTWEKKPILPGESSEIKVRYDTKRVGAIRKTVRITTNEGGNAHVLQVVGKVLSPEKPEALPKEENKLTGSEK